MPKSKKRKRAGPDAAGKIAWGTSAATPRRRSREWLIVGAVAAVIVVGGGVFLFQSSSTKREFNALAAQGAPALARVATQPSDGRRHLDAGERWFYADRYPTSGPHETIWTRPGFYDESQPPTRLVHALEHGNVVVYYDTTTPEALDTLRRWTRLYPGQWDGMVLARDPSLGASIVLAAWTKRLRLDAFDAAATAAFIDAFRGRGPENPVR